MILKKLKKNIVVPMVTAMLCISMLQPTVIDAIDLSQADRGVTVNEIIVDESLKEGGNKGDTRVEGEAYEEGWIATYNNFLDMRRELEGLTGSYVVNGRGYGNLYRGTEMVDWHVEYDEQTPRLRLVTNTEWYRKYYYSQEIQEQLKSLASKTFSDVDESDWYASMIPTSVYYGVINGYEDGTFKGSNSVTYAEFAKMFTTAYWQKAELKKANSLFGEQWFNDYLKPLDYSVMTIDELNSPIARGEVAQILAENLYTDDYIAFNNSTFAGGSTNTYWSDMTTIGSDISVDDLDLARQQIVKAKGNSKIIPSQIYSAVEAMRKNGVMVGNEAKECNWNEPVTRAEALKMIITASENTIDVERNR